MADPRYGSTGSHLGVLRSVLGENEYRSFLLGLDGVGVQLVTGGKSCRSMRSHKGRSHSGPPMPTMWPRPKPLGQPVDFLPLPLDEAGTLGDDRRSSSGRSADR